MFLLWVALAGTAAPTPLAAQDIVLQGRVLRIIDGDTVRVSLSSGPINIRLHATDAPERRQPWGPEATAALSQHIAGRAVELEVIEQRDGYGRMVARIFVDGRDVNAWLIRQGHAWAYRQYARRTDGDLCDLEARARQARRGLWGLPTNTRIAPWEWRRNQRGKARSFTDWSRETPENCRANLSKTPDRMRPPGGSSPMPPSAVALAAASNPPGTCAIKGNISRNGRIYHLPNSASYARTTIDESKGERWFCSEREAQAAGWRPPR
jgi:endonuclease YncB( thermonuclease family)